MVAIAGRIAEAGPRLATVWPGYWPDGQPFIIYVPAEGALLVSGGERPQFFQPLRSPDPGDTLRGRAFWHDGRLADVERPFVTDYPIGQGKTAILANSADADAVTIPATLLHEQFHVYQSKAFKRYAFSQFVDPLAIRDRVSFAASAETERRLLATAVGTADPKALRKLLQAYFALRREREAAMPAQAVMVERSFERIEGTARYVERTGLAAIDGGPARLTALLLKDLQGPLASRPGAFSMTWFRGRSYGTGAAITYLVSRLDQGGWRAKIEAGAMPDAILESLVERPSAKAAAALARSARKTFGYATLLREVAAPIRAGERSEIKSVGEFLAGAPYLLILESGPKGDAGWAAPTMVQLGPQTIALPKAATFNYSGPSMALTATNLPLLVEAQRYTVLLPGAPRIVGLASPPPGEHRLASAVIQGAGVALKIDRPVVVTVSEASMTVRVLDP
jgi:hypothetical protein